MKRPSRPPEGEVSEADDMGLCCQTEFRRQLVEQHEVALSGPTGWTNPSQQQSAFTRHPQTKVWTGPPHPCKNRASLQKRRCCRKPTCTWCSILQRSEAEPSNLNGPARRVETQ
eukprot:1681968-Amphidinium_carterae.1